MTTEATEKSEHLGAGGSGSKATTPRTETDSSGNAVKEEKTKK